MASLGGALLGLMGTKDPRQQLAATLLQGGAATRGGAGSTPAGAPGAPGTTPAPGAPQPPAAPAQPEVYQSPPQLMELFNSLQEYSNKTSNVDRGIGLIAASMAQEGNRDDILSATQGNPSDPNADLGLLMQMQQQQTALAEKSRLRAEALATAEKLGIDPATASYLDESGQLGSYITTLLKPKEVKTEVLKRADGSQALIDTTTGNIVRELSPAEIKQRETEVVGSDEAGRILIDSVTGQPIADVQKPVPREFYRQLTPEEVAAKRLDPTKSYEISPTGNIEQIGGNGTTVTVNTGDGMNKVDEKFLQGIDDDLTTRSYPAAQASLATLASVTQATEALNSPGGIITGSAMAPWENEVRKVAADMFGIDDPATVNTAQFEAAQADVVRSKIKELGTGNAISNADLVFTLNSIGAGGQIPQEAIPRILKIMEVGSYNQILRHNQAVDAAIAGRGPDIRPDVKAGLEAKKIPVPEISIPSDAIADLKKAVAEGDEAAMAEFNEIFGPGTAENLIMVK